MDLMRDGTILPHTNLKFTESEDNPYREVESQREREREREREKEREREINRGKRYRLVIEA